MVCVRVNEVKLERVPNEDGIVPAMDNLDNEIDTIFPEEHKTYAQLQTFEGDFPMHFHEVRTFPTFKAAFKSHIVVF